MADVPRGGIWVRARWPGVAVFRLLAPFIGVFDGCGKAEKREGIDGLGAARGTRCQNCLGAVLKASRGGCGALTGSDPPMVFLPEMPGNGWGGLEDLRRIGGTEARSDLYTP